MNDRNSLATLNEWEHLIHHIDKELAEQLEPEINYWKNILQRVFIVIKELHHVKVFTSCKNIVFAWP